MPSKNATNLFESPQKQSNNEPMDYLTNLFFKSSGLKIKSKANKDYKLFIQNLYYQTTNKNPRKDNKDTPDFKGWKYRDSFQIRYEQKTKQKSYVINAEGKIHKTIEFADWKKNDVRKWNISSFNYLIGDPIMYSDLNLREKPIKSVLMKKATQSDGSLLIRLKIRDSKDYREKINNIEKYHFFGKPQSRKWYIDLHLKNNQNLGTFLKKPRFQYSATNKRCSDLDSSGYRCFDIQSKNGICKKHYEHRLKLEIFESNLKQLRLKQPPHSLKLPKYLEPYTEEAYPPNEIVEIKSSNSSLAYFIKARFYGNFGDHKFTQKDLSPNIKRVLCIHDATHSVAMFYKAYDKKQNISIALHSEVPFIFPFTIEYTKYYSQRLDLANPIKYPLVILERKLNVKYLLNRNGFNTQNRRWCTRIYKIEMTKIFYKNYDIGNPQMTRLVQIKGMTKHQSAKRNKMFTKMYEENDFIDPMSYSSGKLDKRLSALQEFPIYDMTEEQLLQFIKSKGVKQNPVEKIFWGEHGCMLCPYRDEEYFLRLKTWYPSLYKKAHTWRKHASYKMEKGKEYFYFPNSKIM